MKYFDEWNDVKKSIEARNRKIYIKEREIWWNHLGCNIGHEQDGKGKFFERPVLVIRKFNQRIFLGVPISTKNKNNKFYIQFRDSNDFLRSAIISQIRLFDVTRLSQKDGLVSMEAFQVIKKAIKDMI